MDHRDPRRRMLEKTQAYLLAHADRLTEAVGAKLMPPRSKGGPPSYGCGGFGCVFQTRTKGVVIKATYDATEGRFVERAIALGEFPAGIVRYAQLIDDPAEQLWLLWREEAYFGGRTEPMRYRVHEDLIDYQKIASQFRMLNLAFEGEEVWKFKEQLETLMKEPAPREESLPVWEALRFYVGHGMVITDLHDDNLGVVKRDGQHVCVITDPGHVAFLSSRPAAEPISIARLTAEVQKALTPELLKACYREKNKSSPLYGHCYTASEALYHLLGELRPDLIDSARGGLSYRPTHARDPANVVHWWLEDRAGRVIDPTEGQYTSEGLQPPYDAGRGGFFLTTKPSKQAKVVIDRVKAALGARERQANPLPRGGRPGESSDLDDAVQHYALGYRSETSGRVCFRVESRHMALEEILGWDDYGSWGEFEKGELAGRRHAEAFEGLVGFRGRAWAERAMEWVEKSQVPPIVLVDGKDGQVIGDGRGRVNLAMAFDLPELEVIVLTEDPQGELCYSLDDGQVERLPGRASNPLPAGITFRPVGWNAAGDEVERLGRPGHLYRGVTEEEWASIERAGAIQSSMRYSHESEGTNFDEDIRGAESYVNYGRDDPRKTGRPTYLLEIPRLPGIVRAPDGYWKTKAPVPVSFITRAWRMVAEGGRQGVVFIGGKMPEEAGAIVAYPQDPPASSSAAPEAPRVSNPLPKIDEQHKLDRPHGWAFTQLRVQQQAAWILSQEIWMVSPMSWGFATTGDPLRRDVIPLLEFGYKGPDELLLEGMREAAAASGKLLAVLGTIREREDRAFINEREIEPRLARLRYVLGEIIVIVEQVIRKTRKPFGPLLAKIAAQELSVTRTALFSDPPLPLASLRVGMNVDRQSALETWAYMTGYIRDQAPPLEGHSVSYNDDTACLFRGFHGELTTSALPLMLKHLAACTGDDGDPYNAWLRGRLDHALETCIGLLPTIARHDFVLFSQPDVRPGGYGPNELRPFPSTYRLFYEASGAELTRTEAAKAEGRAAAKTEAQEAAMKQSQWRRRR